MDKIKIALCDDAKYLCDGFRAQFEELDDISVCGISYTAKECPEMVRRCKPDILLLDINLETPTSGIDVISVLKNENPNLKIIMLTGFNDEQYIFRAFLDGAEDYCEKTMDFAEIAATVRNVYNDQIALRPEISKKLVQMTRNVVARQQSLLYMYNKIAKLSIGEFELLRSLYYGDSYKTIAREKCVETESVKKMAKRLLKRLEVKNMNILLEQVRQLRIFALIEQTTEY